MTTLFANNVSTQLAGAIDAVQTSIPVLDGSDFPAGISLTDPIWVTFADADNTLVEITLCTAVSGNTLTVVRGQDGTPAQSHPLGAYVEARLVRAVFTELQGDIAGKIGEAPADGLGYVRDGAAADWHRGAKVFVAATEPPEMNIGDFWVEG